MRMVCKELKWCWHTFLHISKALSAKYNLHRCKNVFWLKIITVWKVFQPFFFLHCIVLYNAVWKVELFLCPWNFFYFLTVTLSSEGWKLVKATLKKNNSFTTPMLKQKRSNFLLLFSKQRNLIQSWAPKNFSTYR